MNFSFALDYLLSQTNGDTLFFVEKCPLGLIKESILRDFQIQKIGNREDYTHRVVGCGERVGNGFCMYYNYEDGKGSALGMGFKSHTGFNSCYMNYPEHYFSKSPFIIIPGILGSGDSLEKDETFHETGSIAYYIGYR